MLALPVGSGLTLQKHKKKRLRVHEQPVEYTIAITNKFITMEWKYVLSSVIFSFIGIFVLGFSFWFFEKISPESLWKEIIDEHNTALAIMAGAFMVAMGIIIASAMHG